MMWNTYNQDQNDGGYGVFGRRFAADGTTVGGEFQVNTTTAGSQVNPSIAKLADGGFVVTWSSYPGQDGSGWGVYTQRYDAGGTKAGGETRANVTTANDQFEGAITGLADGDYAVVWTSTLQDGSDYGVYGRIFNADGSARTGEFQLHENTVGKQNLPTVAALADGSLMTLWRSFDAAGVTYAIEGRRFDAQGVALGGEFQISDDRYTSSLTGNFAPISARHDGGLVAYWHDATNGDNAFITKVFDANPTVLGAYAGTSVDDVLFGSSGEDTLTGRLGADVFHFESPAVGLDTITDFQAGVDVVEVVSGNFGGLATGRLDASRFARDAAGDADTRFVFDTATGVLSYDTDGTGSMAPVGLAKLNVGSLGHTDILVVA